MCYGTELAPSAAGGLDVTAGALPLFWVTAALVASINCLLLIAFCAVGCRPPFAAMCWRCRRCLSCLQERYRGLAQIADTNFKDPKIIGVELVVFEDAACFGVLWAPPMHTFSFFVRQPGLP